MKRLVPSGHDIRPRTWKLIHPWCRDPVWNAGIKAGLNLARQAENGDPTAIAMRTAIEREG